MKTFVKDWMCFAVFSVLYIQAWSSMWSFLEREGLSWTQALLPTWLEEKQLQTWCSPTLAGQGEGEWCNFRAGTVRRENSSWLWAGPSNRLGPFMEQNGGKERAGYGTHSVSASCCAWHYGINAPAVHSHHSDLKPMTLWAKASSPSLKLSLPGVCLVTVPRNAD